jgi:hypothetical protein
VTSILFRLSEEGQENVTKLGGHMVCAYQLQGICEVEHLGNRGGLFERIVAECECYAGHLPMELLRCLWSTTGDNFRLAFRCWMFDPDVQTASADRIPKVPFFVAGDDYEGNASGFDGAEFGIGSW